MAGKHRTARWLFAARTPAAGGGVAAVFALTMFTSGGMILLSLVSGVLTARFLGTVGRGEVSAVSSWTLTLAWASSLGFATSMVYYYNRREADERRSLTAALLAIPVLGGVGVAIGHLLIPIGFAAQAPETQHLARMFFFGVPFVIALESIWALLAAYHSFRALNLMRISQPLLYGLGLVGLLFVGNFTPFMVLLTQVISYAVPSLGAAVVMSCRIGLAAPTWQLIRKGLGYGLRLQGVNFGQLVTTRLDLMLLPAFVAAAPIGYYSIAVNVASMVMSLFGSLSMIVFPLATRDANTEIVRRGLRVAVLGGAVVVTPLGLISPWLISAVYGDDFVAAVPSLLLLLPGIVAWSGTSILGVGVQAAGRPGRASIAQLVGMVVTIASLALLLPRYGIEGAALSSSIAYASTLLFTLWVLRRSTFFSIREAFSLREIRSDVTWVQRTLARRLSARPSEDRRNQK